MLRQILATVAALSCAFASSLASARPFNVDDLLYQESLGAAAIDPGGRWLVFEQRDHYDSAARFDNFTAMGLSLSHLRVADLRRPQSSQPLLTPDPGPGVVMGAFSPSGARLAIYRFQDHHWTLGLVTLATRQVLWLNVTPQDPGRGRDLQWLSDRELLVLDRPDGMVPTQERSGWVLAERMTKAWDAAAAGAGAHTISGSGVYASLRERGAPNRLLRINAETGAQQDLAKGQFIDLEIAPDGARVALFESGPDLQSHGDSPVRGPAGLETEATRLSILDLRSGQRLASCPECDALPNLLSWAPNGRSLMVFARGGDGLWTSGRFLRVDAATGRTAPFGEALAPHFDFNTVAVFTAWMGDDPLIFGRPDRDAAREDWFRLSSAGPVNLTAALPAPDKLVRLATPQGLTVLAKGSLWRVDARGQAPTSLAQSVRALVFGDLRPPAAARLLRAPPTALWLMSAEPGATTLSRLDAEGLHLGQTVAGGAESIAAVSPSGEVAAAHDTDPHGVERLVLLRAGAAPAVVTTVNAAFADTDPLNVTPVHHAGPEGQPLVSWMFLPPPNAAGVRAPLLVRPYLGDNYPNVPHDRSLDAGFLENLRVLNGRGYAVLVPSLPNPAGGMVEPGDHLADRILGVVDAALADPRLAARVDGDRMALLGWSFGGYTVMEAITQTRRFKAAVEMDGISDFVSTWAALPALRQIDPEIGYISNWHTGVVEATQPTLLGPPWAQLDRYTRNSPLYAAKRIETPLLLIHGVEDAVPSTQSEAMFSALFRQGKDAILALYWGMVHDPTSPGDARDIYARTFSFLDDQLGAPTSPAAMPSPARPELAPASGAPTPRR